MSNDLCPCGSEKSHDACCGAILAGSATANSAEQLMRSRYSAYCLGHVDYLIASHHPSRRQANDRQMIHNTVSRHRWLKLQIIHSKQGREGDYNGEVEFVASFIEDGHFRQLHERSRFVKEDNQWYYLDGDIFDTVPKAYQIKRNDPCWCGSNKKYKKCHGA